MLRKALFTFLTLAILLTSGIIPAYAQADKTQPPASLPPTDPGPAASGPDQYPAGVNPLTGLSVSNPLNLNNPPALVSVTNWPQTARPQAGLSYSPIVFEVYIGEGMSRFLAMFYGDFPPQAKTLNEEVKGSTSPAASMGEDSANLNTSSAAAPQPEPTIGPIRSGRLFYEHIRQIYNGFLIMASAYKGVAQHLEKYSNVFGSDEDNINSAMIKVSSLEKIAQANQTDLGASLSGMRFDPVPPAGGVPAGNFWFMYNILNQIVWQYNPQSGGYQRYQYTEEKNKTFVQATDRLNKQPLSYNNIVVLFANHMACKDTAFDIDLTYVKRGDALLFRDGQKYKISWTSLSGDYEKKTGKMRPIRFIDDQGNPFPFKPGQTWIHIVPTHSNIWEIREADKLNTIVNQAVPTETSVLFDMVNKPLPGTGTWVMRYFSSLMITDNKVCELYH